MSYQSGYLLGGARQAQPWHQGLGALPGTDVPSLATDLIPDASTLPVDLTTAAPPLTALQLTPTTPNVFLVPRPQVATLPGAGGVGLSFTPTTLALGGAGLLALLLLSRRRR